MIWAVVRQFLDPKTVAKVHIMGSGPKMYAKLKEALGDDCFITQDMVCCKKADVGKAEQNMGLQSGMAASQTWIRERAMSGIPWSDASASASAASASSSSAAAAAAAAAAARRNVAGFEPGNGGGVGGGVGSPVTSAALSGLGGGGGGNLAPLRTPSSASAKSVDSDGEDQFFDAEEDAFSDDFGDYYGEAASTEDPMSPGMEQFNRGGKCMSAIMGGGGGGGGGGGYVPPVHESRVKLIDGSETPSNGRSRAGNGGGGGAGATAAAAEAAEAEKDARAAKKCCGCC